MGSHSASGAIDLGAFILNPFAYTYSRSGIIPRRRSAAHRQSMIFPDAHPSGNR